MNLPYLVIILGLSGAGKSVAISALEEQGFYYLDNCPCALFDKLMELLETGEEKYQKVAISLNWEDLPIALAKARNNFKVNTKVLFLECSQQEIITRYKRTRRKHPYQQGNIPLLQAIKREVAQAQEIKVLVDEVIDTTFLDEVDLRTIIFNKYGQTQFSTLQVGFISFGFKYGIPLDADLILDVRFLINPYYVPRLKHHTGQDEEVAAYIFGDPATSEFMEKTRQYLDYLFGMYIQEGKSNCLVGIGCTGGKHRSVAVAIALAKFYNSYQTYVVHREI